MELVAEDGSVVYVPEGCSNELGRGHGIASHDRTVSRCHVLLEFTNAMHPELAGQLSVNVQGKNPICVVHTHECGQELTFLKKGDVDKLLPDDKISLSIVHPTFFTLKRKYHVEDHRQEFGRDSIPSMLDHGVEKGHSMRDLEQKPDHQIEPGSEAADSAFRKVGIESGTRQSDSSNEEEAIAQAIARRERRGFERRQKQEWVSQMRDIGETSAENGAVQDHNYGHVDIKHSDPVKEFGFFVEGKEFEQYKRSSDGSVRISPLKKTPTKDEGEGDSDFESKAVASRKRTQNAHDDEWIGDDEEEKKSIFSVGICRSGAKQSLRSRQPVKSNFTDKLVPFVANEDKNLGGFIVDDEEQEEVSEEEEEEEDFFSENEETNEDEEYNEETNENDEYKDVHSQPRKKAKQDEQDKPFCKYGKSCYRKNKDHLTSYQH